jgi:hypothetical protein
VPRKHYARFLIYCKLNVRGIITTRKKCPLAGVLYPRRSVKDGPNAMPGEGRADSITAISGGFMYSPANTIEGSAWSARVDSSLECGIRHAHEVSARFVLPFNQTTKNIMLLRELSYNVSDEERFRGITVIFVQVDCDIDVNYISILERPAVAY